MSKLEKEDFLVVHPIFEGKTTFPVKYVIAQMILCPVFMYIYFADEFYNVYHLHIDEFVL